MYTLRTATGRPLRLTTHHAWIRMLLLSSQASASQLRFYVQIPHRAICHPLAATVTLNGWQIRYQSTPASEPKKRFTNAPKPPPPSMTRSLLRLASLSFSNLSRAFRGENFRNIFRQHPEQMVLALLTLAATMGILFYAISLYFTYFYSEKFTRLPEPVAKSMRRALYYSNYAPDPRLAMKYYKLAIEQSLACGLDPFSDEFMGIRIQLAAWLEQIGKYQNSIEVLETQLSEIKKWVQVMEQAVLDGTAPEIPSLAGTAASAPPAAADGGSASGTSAADVPRETIWGKRNRVLKRAIGISVKLGDLYADDHVLNQDLAHEKLTWAVEESLKEMRRRSVEGVKKGEGGWLSGEEMGGSLEALGNSYLTRGHSQLAVPLFFQALPLCRDPCHSAVIMNNLAASFAHHPVQGPGATLIDNIPVARLESQGPAAQGPAGKGPAGAIGAGSGSPAENRATYLEFARNWANNASKLAAETKCDGRTRECDEACAVSLCNLGDIARLLGDDGEARTRFQQCVKLSRSLGYATGLTQAEAGLRSLAVSEGT